MFPYLQTDSQTHRQRDELIWGGLGNLRFLQINGEELRKMRRERGEDVLVSTIWSDRTEEPVISSPCGLNKVYTSPNNRVVLKRQFTAFYSLVVCKCFRQTETP